MHLRYFFEETYKEYELIMIYSYMQNYTNDITPYNVYQDLIDESLLPSKMFWKYAFNNGNISNPKNAFKKRTTNEMILKSFYLMELKRKKWQKKSVRNSTSSQR